MSEFFWLTVVGSILGLVYAFSKGDGDGWDVAKVILAVLIFVGAIIAWFITGEDPLSDDKPSNRQIIIPPPGPGPNDVSNPKYRQDRWNELMNQDYGPKEDD